MKLTYNEVQSLNRAFKELEAIQSKGLHLPSKVSYYLHKNRCRIEDKWHQLERGRKEQMISMIEVDKNGQPVVKKTAKGEDQMVIKDQKAFEKLFEEYKKKEVEVNISKIHFEAFFDDISGEHEAMELFWAIAETINNLIENNDNKTTPSK